MSYSTKKHRVHQELLTKLTECCFNDDNGFWNWNGNADSDGPTYPDTGMYECECSWSSDDGNIYIHKCGYGTNQYAAEVSASMAVRVELMTILDAEIYSIEKEKKSEPA